LDTAVTDVAVAATPSVELTYGLPESVGWEPKTPNVVVELTDAAEGRVTSSIKVEVFVPPLAPVILTFPARMLKLYTPFCARQLLPVS